MNFRSVNLRNLGAGALIFCVTLLAYLPALAGAFIWNDSDYVTAPALRSLTGLARIWNEPGATQQYYPLLHSAFWVQHRLWGDHPLGYHIVTLLLHAGSAVLFALILRRLFDGGTSPSTPLPPSPGLWRTGRAFDSEKVAAGHERRRYAGVEWLAALLFALHPVHVESVAWITEQKNTLSLAFYLAAALVYLQFDGTRRPRTYVAALALFVFSLWCKTVTATLPAALLVTFWWKRGRLDWRRDVLPLLPWLVLGAATGLFSSWVEQTYIGAQGVDFNLPILARVLVAGQAIWFYASKLVWPFGLNFVYPRWTVDTAIWWQWLFPLGVLAVGAVLWALRRRTRGPLAAFLFFVGSLFPVLGFVNLYGARYSWVWDHWQYLPDLGLLALAAAGLTAGWRRAALQIRGLGFGLVAALAVLLGALTWSHCGMFHDDQTLYRTTLARNPACWMAHTNLGDLISKIPGRLPEAIGHFEAALRINPRDVHAHNDLGLAFTKIPGRLPAAIAEYEAALRIDPRFAPAHNNLAWVLQQQGKTDEANTQYARAVALQPDYVTAHYDWGVALLDQGRAAEAVIQLEAAVRLAPGHADALVNLGNALMQVQRAAEAVACYEQALRLKPGADVHYDLGVALAELDRRDEAAAHLRTALALAPDLPKAHYQLARLAELAGRPADAEREYLETLRLAPDHTLAHAKLGLLLAQSGRLAPAAEHFRIVIHLQPGDADAHANLGNVLLLQGQAREAIAQYEETLRLRPDDPRTRENLELARESLQASPP